MEMLKIIWNYALETGSDLIPKKRYALALGLLIGFIAGWQVFG